MPKNDLLDSGTEKSSENSSSSEELTNPTNGGDNKRKGVSEYEKQRLSRIAENKKRMEALGLSKMASSLMGTSKKQNVTKINRKKGKGKMGKDDDDEDYKPEDEGMGSPSNEEGDDDDGEGEDENFVGRRGFVSRRKKVKNRGLKPKMKASSQKISSSSNFIDDDDALMQAIALSLQEPVGVSEAKDPNATTENMKNTLTLEDTRKRKRKKPFSSRLQMTEDELLLHFYQFDGDWKGNITANDIQRVATAHDFTWTDKELADMIHCFDSDGDGKLSLDDFRNIVGRCSMIKGSGIP